LNHAYERALGRACQHLNSGQITAMIKEDPSFSQVFTES
jgi:hypothetical protein